MRISKALEKVTTRGLWELNSDIGEIYHALVESDKHKKDFWLAVGKCIRQEIDNRLNEDFEK